MKEFMEEYGSVVLALVIVACVIHGFARIYLEIRGGGV